MRILGISCYFHDAAAALIEDGKLVAAAEEERFTRKKHDFGYPIHAINFCLNHAGISGKELDYVVFFEKPFVKFDRLMQTALDAFPRTYPLFVQSMKTWLLDKLWIKNLIVRSTGIEPRRVLFSDHHLSHAASAYYCSPFDEAAVLTFDGVGEWSTTTLGIGKGTNLVVTDELHFPHSIGLLYSAFTAFLGFEVNEGEYKVMGMAPYGTPRYVEDIQKMVRQYPDGTFWLDPRYFSFHYSTKLPYTQKFVDTFGQPRDPKVPFFTDLTGFPAYYGDRPGNFEELIRYNQRYADMAASIQLVTEEMILGLARELHRRTGLTRLCLAGGVALNSVANGRIMRETPFKELFVQPSAGDGGGALGAALFAGHTALGEQRRFVMEHAYWGEEFTEDNVRRAIDGTGLKAEYAEDPDGLVERTVARLLDGRVVGWFQGRFEWGPRALGNRSILADPRRPEMKDLVNAKVKFREPFRPFAPSVLAQRAEDYFDLANAASVMPARFMLLVTPVRESKQPAIPAVNHMGTARMQTVHEDMNPLYHGLISKFCDATGVPVLLNTSFNVRGEPIVRSPTDAMRTFQMSGLDTVVLGPYIVDKP